MISGIVNSTSLTIKVLLISALSIFAVCGTLAFLYASGSRDTTRDLVLQRGVSEAKLVANTLYGATRFSDVDSAKALLQNLLEASDGIALAALVMTVDGTVLAATDATPDLITDLTESATSNLATGLTQIVVDGDIIAAPIRKSVLSGEDAGQAVGIMIFSWSPAIAVAQHTASERRAILTSIGVAVLALGLTIMLARILLIRPLNIQQQSIHRISQGELDVPSGALDRRDEIGAIAQSVEDLRATLTAAAAGQKEIAYKGTAFNAASSAMMMTDNAFRILYANPAMIALLTQFQTYIPQLSKGVTVDGVTQLTMDDFHPNAPHVRERLKHIGNDTLQIMISFGDNRVSLAISRITDREGQPIGLIMEWSDVTEQWLNSAILRGLDSQQLRLDLDAAGRVLRANRNLCTAIGRDMDQLIGQSFSSLIGTQEAGAQTAAEIITMATDRDMFAGQIVLTTAANAKIIVDGNLSCVRDSSKTPIRFILLARDITQTETALKDAVRTRQAAQHEQSLVVDALRIGLRQMSEGNLSAVIETPFPGSYEDLRADYNGAVTTLADAIRGVVENADNISNEARDISGNTDGLSRRTEATAATLEQTAAALNDLTTSIRVTAQGAKDADIAVRDARKNAEQSGQVVLETVSAMDQIAHSSGRITSIIKVIDDIAFQTNLLALNAGVEAARAGDAGRGFAVVASEVRALAQRSSDAAREINDLIDKSGSQVKHGVDLVGRTGSALQEIVDSVSRISGLVSTIAESSLLQSTSLNDINASLNQLDQSTQQNAARLEETTAASESLRKDAVALVETVSYFKLAGSHDGGDAVVPFRARPRPPRAPAELTRAALRPEAAAAGGWEDF
ncbi:methyl-accepting chemotaxis protein [Loktanella sp. DJP18]|uniref:methyl-accepting chemotaxis protein n=1 Tax=Loktanella sp. DJP18 TaxID=3409788 RepID=UPI003BB573EE